MGSTWTTFRTTDRLPHNSLYTLGSQGKDVWFSGGDLFVINTLNRATKFDGTTWTVYNTSNSPLPNDTVYAINRDPDGTYWFGTGGGGVAKFDGTIWTVYNTFNSGLSNDWVFSISTDLDGSHWFGTESGVTHFDGISWKVYNSSNSELPYDFVSTLAINKNGLHWFGVEMFGHDVMFAIGVLNLTPLHTVTDNDIWLNDTHFQASFDITSLIELGDYRLTVEGATGTDGIQIAPNTNTTFTVDYAGAVSDTSAPPEPVVLACGADTPDTLSASWTAADPDSAITLYQYAIGTTPGGADIVNWIDTGETSFLRDNLSLLAGQTYYVSVKARNEGGLWSEAGISSGVVAGSGTCPSVGFSADVLNGEAPLTVQFSDQSSGDVTGWLWDFGDGNTSTLQHPEHVYGEAGVYSVALLISGPGGSDLETKVGYIVVYPGDITYSVTLPLVSK